MTQTAPSPQIDNLLQQARQHDQNNEVLQAEQIYAGVLRQWPECVEAGMCLARYAMDRQDANRAANLLERVRAQLPDEPQIALNLAFAYGHSGRPGAARKVLDPLLARFPDFYQAWLLLSRVLGFINDKAGSDKAAFQALRRAQLQGHWRDEASTPPQMLETVFKAIEQVRQARDELYRASFASLREAHGEAALRRVEQALQGFLGDTEIIPAEHQHATFFFVPALMGGAVHAASQITGAIALQNAAAQIQAEARALQAGNAMLELALIERGVANTERLQACPETAAALQSLALFAVDGHSPMAAFSVLPAGARTTPHTGRTNARVSLELPLAVPGECVLHFVNQQQHPWREGEVLVFDDTYLHEEWNRSTAPMLSLRVDLWHPDLSIVEQQALKQLFEAISRFEEVPGIL